MKKRCFYFVLLVVSAFLAFLAACGEGEPINLDGTTEMGDINVATENVVDINIPNCFKGLGGDACPDVSKPVPSSSSEEEPPPPPPISSSANTNPGSSSATGSVSSSSAASTLSSSSRAVSSSSAVVSSSSVTPSSSSVAVSSSSRANSSSSVAGGCGNLTIAVSQTPIPDGNYTVNNNATCSGACGRGNGCSTTGIEGATASCLSGYHCGEMKFKACQQITISGGGLRIDHCQ